MADLSDDPIERLEEIFANLPGLGPKSSARIVSELLTQKKTLAHEMCETLTTVLSHVHTCPKCHTLTTESVCALCRDTTRDNSVICIVETPADLKAIEKSVAYRGGYFVLMGRVNPLEGVGPEELGIFALLDRIASDKVSEVVIATSYTPEGETTAHFIGAALKKHFPEVKVTRLARGLPTGVEIEYTDAATIASAVIGRR